MGDIEKDKMERIITLTTDFGLKDPYQGAMKGSILSVNPAAVIVDITHLVTPGDINEGALVLRDAYAYYPAGTIHVGVIDPGVGGDRRPILIETERHIFVGPDNGLFTLAIEREKVLRVIRLTNKIFFLKTVSSTFHGRDIFGPAAAHLSLGVDPAEFGERIGEMTKLRARAARREGEAIAGEVVYIDSFGNLITNIEKEEIAGYEGAPEVVIKGLCLEGITKTYSGVSEGAVAALIGSSGRLEIAVNSGSASKVLGVGVGERVIVRAKKR